MGGGPVAMAERWVVRFVGKFLHVEMIAAHAVPFMYRRSACGPCDPLTFSNELKLCKFTAFFYFCNCPKHLLKWDSIYLIRHS